MFLPEYTDLSVWATSHVSISCSTYDGWVREPIHFFCSYHFVCSSTYTRFNQTAVWLINNKSTPSTEVPWVSQERGNKEITLHLKICDAKTWSFHISLSSNTLKCQGQTISPCQEHRVQEHSTCVHLWLRTCCTYTCCLCLQICERTCSWMWRNTVMKVKVCMFCHSHTVVRSCCHFHYKRVRPQYNKGCTLRGTEN